MREAANEIPSFEKAILKMREINGFSVSGDKRTFMEIEDILDFTPATKDGRDLRAVMILKAEAKSQEGMFGDGTFLID